MLLGATIASPERVVRDVLGHVGAFLDGSDVDVFVPGAQGSKTPGAFERLFDWNPGGGTRFIPYMRPPSPSWVEQTVVAADGPVLVMADDVPDRDRHTLGDRQPRPGRRRVHPDRASEMRSQASCRWRGSTSATRVVRERFDALGTVRCAAGDAAPASAAPSTTASTRTPDCAPSPSSHTRCSSCSTPRANPRSSVRRWSPCRDAPRVSSVRAPRRSWPTSIPTTPRS